MGGSGFAGGLFEGFQLAQDRAIQAQQLKLQKQMIDAQTKYMDTQDQMHQVNLQNLMRKVNAQAALPQMQDELLGPYPLSPGVEGPQMPAPEIDRGKLASFLQAASQAGEDPDKVLHLMSVADPRIKAIADSLLPPLHEKLGEGEQIVDKRTGRVVAQGAPKSHVIPPGSTFYQPGGQPVQAPFAPQRPVAVGEGQQLVDPTTGQVIHTGPAKKEKPITVGEGQQVIDPATGQVIHQGPAKEQKPMVVPPGASLVMPGQNQPAYTAPNQQRPVAVAPGASLVNPETGEPLYTAPAAPTKSKPVALSPGQSLVDPETGQPLYSAPGAPERPMVVPPGASLVMPGTGQPSYTAPTAPPRPVPVSPGQALVNPETGQPIYNAPPPTAQTRPVAVSPGQSLVDPQTGQPLYTAPEAQGRPMNVPPGGSVYDPRSGATVFTAPAAPPKPPDFGDNLESAASIYLKHTYGIDGGTMMQLIQMDPIAAEKLRKQVKVEEPSIVQAGKIEAGAKAHQKELLNPEEANKLGVPYGTTKEQAKGIMPLSSQQREALAGFDSARVMIGDIKQYSDKVNTAKGGAMGRMEQASKLWGAYMQSDTDAALLQSKAGELARLARSMGEKGAMAEGDIARAAALVPGVTDTRDVAMRKIKDLTAIIDQAEANFYKSVGIKRAQPKDTETFQPVQPKDPTTANIPVPKNLSPKQQEIYKQEYLKQRQKVQGEMQKGTTNAAKPQR